MLSFAFTLTFVLIVVHPDRGAAKPTMVDICAGCSMKNGVGYMRHTDCNKFVHCYEDGDTKVIGVVQECGPIMAWDQDLMRVKHISDISVCRRAIYLLLNKSSRIPVYQGCIAHLFTFIVCFFTSTFAQLPPVALTEIYVGALRERYLCVRE
ncbi:hypothetical protein DPMN_052807 [Dreissena polymorpha]|uniref:Uncharacterized protein n=1 Tax=Dreissena polymorpha TaxID=45954 RepID=A0A9D4CKB3_DREPO|nr:hypothetical protein DPMN_052807 [Dreissena polymorpha]